jgi:hypothetical protein
MTTRINTAVLATKVQSDAVNTMFKTFSIDPTKVCLHGQDCDTSTPAPPIHTVPSNSNEILNGNVTISKPDKAIQDIELAFERYLKRYTRRDLFVDAPFYSPFDKRFSDIQHPLQQEIVTFFQSQLPFLFPKQHVQMSSHATFLIVENASVYTLATRHSKQSQDFSLLTFKVYVEQLDTSVSRRLNVQLLLDSTKKRIIQINNIALDQSNGVEFINTDKIKTFLPRYNNKEYLELTNTLFLTAPFKTNQNITTITNQQRAEWEKSIQNQKDLLLQEYDYTCFGNLTPLTPGLAPAQDCTSKFGVWDRPVSFDSECPFYKQNKNYPNDFGGQRGHACQLPLGTTPVGYRHHSAKPAEAPLCYNCLPEDNRIGKGTLGRCCDSQNNTTRYPKLNGPDYAFAGDSAVRNVYSDALIFRGLSID